MNESTLLLNQRLAFLSQAEAEVAFLPLPKLLSWAQLDRVPSYLTASQLWFRD